MQIDISFPLPPSLRVLLGAEKSFVFDISEDSVTLRRGIQLSHLTPVNFSLLCNLHNTSMEFEGQSQKNYQLSVHCTVVPPTLHGDLHSGCHQALSDEELL